MGSLHQKIGGPKTSKFRHIFGQKLDFNFAIL